MADDWENWADEDGKDATTVIANNPIATELVQEQKIKAQKEEQKQQKLSKDSQSQEKSKESDMDNILSLFQDGDSLKERKMTQADFNVIGENLAQKLCTSSVSPMNTKEFLKSLLVKLDKKLSFQDWEEVYQVIDVIYLDRKKKFEAEEALKKKKETKGPPKGISWGKTKGQMDLNDDDGFGDDDDFM